MKLNCWKRVSVLLNISDRNVKLKIENFKKIKLTGLPGKRRMHFVCVNQSTILIDIDQYLSN